MWRFVYTDELYHYGIKGMRWGIQRSKEKLAKRTKRNESDISDEEAVDFMKDVYRLKMNKDSFGSRRKIRLEARKKYGKQYAKAVFREERKNANVKALVGTATFAAGKKVVTEYMNKNANTAESNNKTTSNTKPIR